MTFGGTKSNDYSKRVMVGRSVYIPALNNHGYVFIPPPHTIPVYFFGNFSSPLSVFDNYHQLTTFDNNVCFKFDRYLNH